DDDSFRAAVLLEPGGDVVSTRDLAPCVLEAVTLGRVCRRDRLPALAEVARGNDDHPVAGGADVRDRGLHTAGSGCAEKEHVVVGAKDLPEEREGPLVDRLEDRTAAVDFPTQEVRLAT